MTDKKPLVLVADDEEDIKVVLRMFLETAGYEVLTAYDGLDAIERIKESKPDLVLMDIMMPVIDGIEVVRKMKADPALRDIPVVMLTAASKSDLVEKAIQAGAADYIAKPFEPDAIQAVIAKILKSK